MTKHEITFKLLVEAIKQHRLKKPQGEGEAFNLNLARNIAEMYKIILEAVNSSDIDGLDIVVGLPNSKNKEE